MKKLSLGYGFYLIAGALAFWGMLALRRVNNMGRRVGLRGISCKMLAGVVICLLVGSGASQADEVIVKSGQGTTTNTLGRHGVAAGPTGTYLRRATAYNSNGVPKTVNSTKPNTFPYPTPIIAGGGVGTAADSGLVTNTGKAFTSSGRGCLSYGPGFWDSRCSTAAVTMFAAVPLNGEVAIGIGVATDPAEYSVTFDLGFTPELVFQLVFPAGMELIALDQPPIHTSASVTGIYESNIFFDPVWSFSWLADSADTELTVFDFFSNPIFGLDDLQVESEFLSKVSSGGGVHVLNEAVTVTGVFSPSLAPGEDSITYEYGGTVTLRAEASVPEPHPLLLAVIGLAAIAATRGRCAVRN